LEHCRLELPNDEVCDATDDDSSNADDKIKIKNTEQGTTNDEVAESLTLFNIHDLMACGAFQPYQTIFMNG
jgi:hypothetical protein